MAGRFPRRKSIGRSEGNEKVGADRHFNDVCRGLWKQQVLRHATYGSLDDHRKPARFKWERIFGDLSFEPMQCRCG